MKEKKVSVVIPYCKRITNIKYCLKSLNRQNLLKNEYEVIIGCLEYSIELVDFIKNEVPDLHVILVMVNEKWNVSRARNMAIKEATGEVIVFIDADIIIPKNYLSNHYETHKKSKTPLFVAGQTRDYDEGLDIDNFKLKPFDFYYNEYLSKNINEINLPEDIRWLNKIYIDWSMGWTFNLSLSKKSIINNNLYFDEDFKGWGVEDIEWAYRVVNSGVKMVFSDKIWAIHLPHYRDVNKNHTDEKINFKKMLNKWPFFDVEIVTTFGDIKGNQNYGRIMNNISMITNADYPDICTIEFMDKSNQRILFIGALYNKKTKKIYFNNSAENLNEYSILKTLPLMGISLPYNDGLIDRIYINPEIMKFDEDLREMIIDEAGRISKNVILLDECNIYN